MIIKRVIDEREVDIELTWEEKRAVFEEQEHAFAVSEIDVWIYTYKGDPWYEALSEDTRQELIVAAAHRFRRLSDERDDRCGDDAQEAIIQIAEEWGLLEGM